MKKCRPTNESTINNLNAYGRKEETPSHNGYRCSQIYDKASVYDDVPQDKACIYNDAKIYDDAIDPSLWDLPLI